LLLGLVGISLTDDGIFWRYAPSLKRERILGGGFRQLIGQNQVSGPLNSGSITPILSA
jgi:hypothetical protein